MKKAIKIIKRILHIKLAIAVLLLLPLVVVTFVTSKTDSLFGVRSMVVLSGSMEPTMPTGSVVYVQKSRAYQNGEVISFNTEDGITVTHRVIDTNITAQGFSYITKGDANLANDSQEVAYSSVIGKSMFSIPYIGYAIEFLKTPKGFVLAIVLPILVFIGFELWSIKKEIEIAVEKRVREQLGAAQHE